MLKTNHFVEKKEMKHKRRREGLFFHTLALSQVHKHKASKMGSKILNNTYKEQKVAMKKSGPRRLIHVPLWTGITAGARRFATLVMILKAFFLSQSGIAVVDSKTCARRQRASCNSSSGSRQTMVKKRRPILLRQVGLQRKKPSWRKTEVAKSTTEGGHHWIRLRISSVVCAGLSNRRSRRSTMS